MRIALIGGGGLAKEAAEIAILNGYEVAGYFSDEANTDRWAYLGSLSDALRLNQNFLFSFCIGATNLEGMKRRRSFIDYFLLSGLKFINLISPYAVTSEGVKFGVGVIVAHRAVLSVDSFVGDFCLVNTGAVVGHDAYLGQNSIMAPLSFLGGGARIDSDVLVAPNASVLEGRSVGARSIIGTSATVFRDIKEDSILMPVVTKTMKF